MLVATNSSREIAVSSYSALKVLNFDDDYSISSAIIAKGTARSNTDRAKTTGLSSGGHH